MSFTLSVAVDTIKKPTMPVSKGNILYVGGTGEGNYTTIQDAVDNASDGDTIFVYAYSSPYYENIRIDKSINLFGENKDNTIIDGSYSANVVNFSADWINISEFTLQNSGHFYNEAGVNIGSSYNTITSNTITFNAAGIYIRESCYNTITGNNIVLNSFGITSYISYSNNISGNIISNNTLVGIGLGKSSRYHTIKANIISNNENVGIWLDPGSSNHNITGNTILYQIGQGIFLRESCNNTITDNNIASNYNYGLYLLGPSNNNIITDNNIISNYGTGIILWGRPNSNTIRGNKIISNNDCGIKLRASSINNTIYSNIISNNYCGIHIEYSSNNNTFSCNNISSNHEGIVLYSDTHNNVIKSNNISNNDGGICIEYSNNNSIIYQNNLINNTQNAYDNGTNIWDDGKYGNYWSDYKERYPKARKIWKKGIWNIPYEIEGGNNKDNCPLINQWPKSKPRTIQRNNPFNFNLLERLFDRCPLLEVFLRAMNLLR